METNQRGLTVLLMLIAVVLAALITAGQTQQDERMNQIHDRTAQAVAVMEER